MTEKEIKIYAKANAAELPWGELGVDVVLGVHRLLHLQSKKHRLISMQALST